MLFYNRQISGFGYEVFAYPLFSGVSLQGVQVQSLSWFEAEQRSYQEKFS